MDSVKMVGVQLGMMPHYGQTCPLCHNRIMRGIQRAVKFTRIDPKSGKMQTLFTHLTCAQEHNELSLEDARKPTALSDQATLKLWDTLEVKSREDA